MPPNLHHLPARAGLVPRIGLPRVYTPAVNAGGSWKACPPGPADATLEKRRAGCPGPPNSRATHAAGRDFPGTQNALSSRKRFFSWTVHGPFSFWQDQTGPPQERKRSGSCGERRSKEACAVFAARRKRSQANFAATTMGGRFPAPCRRKSPAPGGATIKRRSHRVLSSFFYFPGLRQEPGEL